MRLPRFTIRLRLVVGIAVILSVTNTTVMTVASNRDESASRKAGYRYAELLATRSAHELGDAVEGAHGTAQDLSQVLGALSAAGGSRAQADGVLRDLITSHPEYLGVWVGWESNAFDGRDAAYRGAPGHDQTGRYIPYWFRDGAAVQQAPLVDYDKSGAGDYYQIPLKTGKDKVIEPYSYDINGKATLMTTVSQPVLRDGRVVGVAGVDLVLAGLQETIEKIRPYGSGRATLVSAAGVVVASGDGEAAGKRPKADTARIARDAMAREHTVQRVGDRSGRETLQVGVPIELTETDTWTLVITLPTSVLLTETRTTSLVVGVIATIALLVAICAALLLARATLLPIGRLRARLDEIADGDGDLTQRAEILRDDEVGDLAGAFNRFVSKLAGTVRGIVHDAERLAGASGELAATAERIEISAADSSSRADAMSATAGQVSSNVSAVSAGAEEMGASIREISKSATESAQASEAAVASIESTTRTVARLGASSAEIGSILDMINSIAEQTNLLALNATIEAARAGAAGKGFAVVASEVKDLAHETARATDEISRRIAAIQADTSSAVAAIDEIRQSVSRVNDYSVAIAASVEEQSATTGEMARAVSEAASGSTDIAAGISGVARAAVETTSGVAETRRSAENVAAIAAEIRQLTGQFRV